MRIFPELWLLMLLVALPVWALDIEVKMLAQGSALLHINGKSQMLRDGARSREGVLLVRATPESALIEYQGQQQTLKLNRRISTAFSEATRAEVRIASSRGGHYVTPGRINGRPVEFMVDTGATSIAMNEQRAISLGIDYRAGRPMIVSTASGQAQAFGVMLNKVSVGDIEVTQVEAVVITGDSPGMILLGNTYLGRVDMRTESGVLLLQARH